MPPINTKDPSFRHAIWALAVAETVVWASFCYLFPALLLEWERDLGWSKTALSGAFTAAQITAALAAPFVGRLIDRHQGRSVLIGSSILGGVLLVALSQVTELWQFYAVWVAIGLTMAGALYEPCFAFLTKYLAGDAKKAITTVALVAGLAGTVAFPGAQVLVGLVGWRGAVLVFALGVAIIAVPLMWMGTRTVGMSSEPRSEAARPAKAPPLSRILHSPVFWLLALAYSMAALEHGMLLTHLLPMLDERGISKEAAVLAASMIGPMQVIGRLVMMAMERRVSVAVTMGSCYVLMAGACVFLYGSTAIPWLIFGYVVLQGAGWGVTSITRPVTTASYLGRHGFGAISGALAVPTMIAMALSPTVAAVTWTLGGYDMVIALGLGAVVLAFVAFLKATSLTAGKRNS
jgi:MFS family permease